MRLTIDPAADTVRLVLSEAAVARRDTLADGIVVETDGAEQIVGLVLSGAARRSGNPAALAGLWLDLSEAPPGAQVARVPIAPPRAAWPAPPPPSAPPAVAAYAGPLTWDPEAEAAMAKVPFFQRGPRRHAAVALARRRGLSTVTADIVYDAKSMMR